jgi:hypothetical protein
LQAGSLVPGDLVSQLSREGVATAAGQTPPPQSPRERGEAGCSLPVRVSGCRTQRGASRVERRRRIRSGGRRCALICDRDVRGAQLWEWFARVVRTATF